MKYKLDFLVIGSQKCATTWIYDVLSSHPQISLPKDKREIEYLGGDLWAERGDDWYFNLMVNKGNNFLSGDVSVEYIFNKNSSKLIFDKISNKNDIKFIQSLRNPSERALSAYYWYFRRGKISNDEDLYAFFENLIDKYKRGVASDIDILERGVYHSQLKNYFDLFSKDQFLLLIFEEINSNSLNTYNLICNFLNISSDYVPNSINSKPKKNSKVKILMTMENYFPKSKVISKISNSINQITRNDQIKFSQEELKTLNLLQDFYIESNIALLDLLKSKKLLSEKQSLLIYNWNNIKYL